tara:strand:+ start:109 stop:828 length:720 start_codon:yes stop_codon:yes gene_type:complete
MEKNPKIALLVPTRKRVSGVKRLLESLRETTKYSNFLKVYFYVDEDDYDSLKFLSNYVSRSKLPHVDYLIGPRIIMSDMINKLYPMTDEFILFCGADDIVFKTPGWDEILIDAVEKVEDGIGLFYGDDLVTTEHASDFATHPVLTRKWVEVLGYLSPPYFSCDYADTWLNDIASAVNRKFKLPFINEHMHPTVGKAAYDSTYAENRQKFYNDDVPSLYQHHKKELEESIEKLRSYIAEL